MMVKKFHVYLADLNPRFGTEPGKVRPVVVLQTDLLNHVHPSTIICPLTSKITPQARTLRVYLPPNTAGIKESSDILLDQIRAIDIRRLIKHLGALPHSKQRILMDNLKTILFE